MGIPSSYSFYSSYSSFYTHDNTLFLFTYSPLYTIYTLLAVEKRETRSYREKRASNAYTQTPTCLRSLANIRAIKYFYYSYSTT